MTKKRWLVHRAASRLPESLKPLGPPRGMAAAEYLLATTALTSAWFMLYSSPAGLGQALIDLLSSYSFSLSLPW